MEHTTGGIQSKRKKKREKTSMYTYISKIYLRSPANLNVLAIYSIVLPFNKMTEFERKRDRGKERVRERERNREKEGERER